MSTQILIQTDDDLTKPCCMNPVQNLGKLLYTKVIENFETFPKSTNTPSYAQWFRSYGHCKLGRCQFWTD
jgi:hypothetical protein